MKLDIKSKTLAIIVYLSPVIAITCGLITLTVAAYMVNALFGTIALGISFVVFGCMLIPIEINGGGK